MLNGWAASCRRLQRSNGASGAKVRSCHLRQSTEYPQQTAERGLPCGCQAAEAGLHWLRRRANPERVKAPDLPPH